MATEATETHLVRQELRRLHLPNIRVPLREALAFGLITFGIYSMQLSRADIESKVQAASPKLHGDLQINAVPAYRAQLWTESLPEDVIFGALVFTGIGLLMPDAKKFVRPKD